MTFDLEKARDAAKFDDRMAITMFPLAIAEIERLRASLTDLHAEYINTLEKNPECSAWDLDEQSDADQRRLRRNAAHAISIVEPSIYRGRCSTDTREVCGALEQIADGDKMNETYTAGPNGEAIPVKKCNAHENAHETLKLYKVTIRGGFNAIGTNYHISYVVASSPNNAHEQVKKFLNKYDLCLDEEGELDTIQLIAECKRYPSCKTILFIEGETI